MATNQWYYVYNGQPQGPFDEGAMTNLAQSGTINAATMVWQEGMTGWTALQNSPLQAIVPVRPSMPIVPPSTPAAGQPGYQVPASAITAQSLNQLFQWFWILLVASIPLSFITIGVFTALAAVVIYYVLIYKYWQLIQDGTVQTTPGKAVGYMFIPFYNFYWNFVAVRGLAQDMNRYCHERAIPAPEVNEQTAQWYCILSICNVIPYVNFVTGVVALVLMIVMLNSFNKTAIAIINAKQGRL